MYPDGHSAIKAALSRIVQVTSPPKQTAPMRLTVMPDTLLMNDRAPAKADTALLELSELLHSHLIGELTVQPGGDADGWRAFLLLIARSPELVRAEGGISRVLSTMPARHVDVREIDYAEVLREREAGDAAIWDRVIANCLQGTIEDLDEETIRHLLGMAKDPERPAHLLAALEARASQEGVPGLQTTAMMRLLRNVISAVSKNEPDRMEATLRNLASGVGQLSAEMINS